MFYLELSKKLEHFLINKIPLMTCVAIIGTTEEGAVDPILGLYHLRQQFRMRVNDHSHVFFISLIIRNFKRQKTFFQFMYPV